MQRVAVAGGNGKIGREILRELSAHGYETLNCSLGEREESVADRYRDVDLTDAGAVYGALSRSAVDAVVHVGTIPSPTNHTATATYRSNVLTSHVLLEAANDIGLERVVLPSSVNVLGATFQDEPVQVYYLPVDEAHPVRPRDPYGVAKHAMEVTADGIARRPGAPSVVSLRYPWVATDEELAERFNGNADDLEVLTETWAPATRDVLCSYLHVEDAASAARHALTADVEGHERVWVAATDSSLDVPTERVIEAFYPDVECRVELSGSDGLIDVSKARELLGWEPGRSWRR